MQVDRYDAALAQHRVPTCRAAASATLATAALTSVVLPAASSSSCSSSTPCGAQSVPCNTVASSTCTNMYIALDDEGSVVGAAASNTSCRSSMPTQGMLPSDFSDHRQIQANPSHNCTHGTHKLPGVGTLPLHSATHVS